MYELNIQYIYKFLLKIACSCMTKFYFYNVLETLRKNTLYSRYFFLHFIENKVPSLV